jgi:excisionase family DNA binding protein
MGNKIGMCGADGATRTPIKEQIPSEGIDQPGHLSTAGEPAAPNSRTSMSTLQQEVISVKELAEILGIAVKSVYNLTSKKQIPYYKPNGKTIVFLEPEIREWIKASRRTPNSEIETIAATEALRSK